MLYKYASRVTGDNKHKLTTYVARFSMAAIILSSRFGYPSCKPNTPTKYYRQSATAAGIQVISRW